MPQTPQPIDYATPGVAPPNRFFRSVFGWVLFIGLAVMLFVLIQGKKRQSAQISFSEFDTLLRAGAIAEIIVEGDEVHGVLPAGAKPFTAASGPTLEFRSSLPQGMSGTWGFMQHLLDNRGGATVSVENNQNILMQVLVPLIPWLLIFLFIWFFVFRQLRKSSMIQREPTPVVVVNQPNS